MITLITKWKLLDGCPPELISALQELSDKSQGAPGNLLYMVNLLAPDPINDQGKPLSPQPPPIPLEKQTEVVFIESYQDLDAFVQHIQSEAFMKFLQSSIKYFCKDPQNPEHPQTETQYLSPQFSSIQP